METLRKLLTVVIILFLVFALLILFNVISTPYLDSTLTTFNPENFYKTIFGIAAALLLIMLVFSYLSSLAASRERHHLNTKINELKASLYDKKVSDTRDARPAVNPHPSNPHPSKPDPIFPPDSLQ